ncbi:hypothetical protein CL632_00935, partial [bacterium]|nr:hypothetical protein [bacterium]
EPVASEEEPVASEEEPVASEDRLPGDTEPPASTETELTEEEKAVMENLEKSANTTNEALVASGKEELDVDFSDGINNPSELALVQQEYLRLFQEYKAGTTGAEQEYKNLQTLVDKSIKQNPKFFETMKIDSNTDIVTREQIGEAGELGLARAAAEGPEWIQGVKENFDSESVDWEGLKNKETWTSDDGTTEYTAIVRTSADHDLAASKLVIVRAQGQTYQVEDKVVQLDNGVYKAVRIFARKVTP